MRTFPFMKRIPFVMILLAFLVGPTARGAETKLNGHTLTMSDGFIIEMVAGPPLVDRPIVADFDEAGRLFVADSAGTNDKVEKQLEERPHRIVRLEDSDGDGRFDRRTVFADKMMFPEGVLCHGGAVYVGAPPSIWKLDDTDGDGAADKRTEWFAGKTLTGCANDIHGPYLGLDGRIYWTKGGFGKQNIARPGKPAITDSAAHIYRARPDGSELESFMSGGMDNPVEIVFTHEGEAIFTTTFFSHPRAGERDALVHAVWGGLYPKEHGVLDGLVRTGELLPPLTHLGPAVPSGLAIYSSAVFGREFEGNLFSTLFNMRKVQRHVLEPAGSTFRSRDEDFLVSDSSDFHPTDVLEDADGSLLVVDTGGWYKLCCPSAQIARPDALGAIYRIRPDAAPAIEDPRGRKIPWKTLDDTALVNLLGDERPAVRRRAMAEFERAGASAAPVLGTVLGKPNPSRVRRGAVWALTRIETEAARAAGRMALRDPDASVRQVAAHSAGLHRDRGAVDALIDALKAGSPHLRRSAAAALGRIGDKIAVAPLLQAARTAGDRFLDHAITYALIEIADKEGTSVGLRSENLAERRTALIAIDQIGGGGPAAPDVAPLLFSADAGLQKAAWWIAGRHPDWGEVAGIIREKLAGGQLTDAEGETIARHLPRMASGGVIQELIGELAAAESTPAAARRLVLRIMASTPIKEAPVAWTRALVQSLGAKGEDQVRGAISAARAVPAPKAGAAEVDAALRSVASGAGAAPDLRLEALGALKGEVGAVDPELFGFLISILKSAPRPGESTRFRSEAASILARSKLSDEQLLTLAEAVPGAGPIEFPAILATYSGATSETVGRKLIESLRESKGLASLRPDRLKETLGKFPESVRKAGEELAGLLDLDPAAQKARLDELAGSLGGGDAGRGKAVFNHPKAACASCHAIGYLGGKAGPDLTRIGSVRADRDLLESLIFPSASFVRSYEPVTITTREGAIHSGVLRHESADSVLIVEAADKEQRFSTAEIREMQPGAVSIMPQGLDAQLTKEEIADLIAFLRSLK